MFIGLCRPKLRNYYATCLQRPFRLSRLYYCQHVCCLNYDSEDSCHFERFFKVTMKDRLVWRALPFVHDLTSGIKTVSRISMNSVRSSLQKLSCKLEFHEERLIDSHMFRKDINEFLLLLPIFLAVSGWKEV